MTDRERRPAYSCLDVGVGNTEMDRMQRRWLEEATALASPNDVVTHAFTRAVEDLGSLRLYEDDPEEESWLPAAGVPWFLTLFGRDSLIAAYQALPIHYPFGLGVLKKLGSYQADGQDNYRDMEPGKILHEIRFGELAHLKVVPHTPYFGTHDATLLYIIFLSETFRWMGARSLLDEQRSRLERCLAWVDRFNETFWMEEEDFYAYGLDSSKQPIKTIASNPGHLLWSELSRNGGRLASSPD